MNFERYPVPSAPRSDKVNQCCRKQIRSMIPRPTGWRRVTLERSAGGTRQTRAQKAFYPRHAVNRPNPVEIQMRLILDHWEGDLINGKGNPSQAGTLVERNTLFVPLVKLSNSRADTTAQAFTEIPTNRLASCAVP